MQFSIHVTGREFRVAAIPAIMSGTYDDSSGDILRPDPKAVRQGIPYRYRHAFDRSSGNFWFDKGSRFNGQRFAGDTPHLTLYGYRGKALVTLYALPCAESVA